MRAAGLGLFLLLGPLAARADPSAAGSLRASLGTEVDTNARRAIEPTDAEPIDGAIQTDGLFRLVLDAYGRVDLGRGFELRGQFLGGAKRFMETTDQDQWSQYSSAELRKRWGGFMLGVAGSFRITRLRSAIRDYAQQVAQLKSEVELGAQWVAGASVGWLAYQFEPQPDFSYSGPSASLSVRTTLTGGLVFGGWVEGYLQDYDGPILVLEDDVLNRGVLCTPTIADIPCEARRDVQVRVGGQLRYDGDWIGGVSYQVSVQESNSEERPGGGPNGEDIALEDVVRHRIGAFATVPLVWQLLLSVQGAIQINDGTSLTDALLLGDEDENRTSLQAQIRRPLFADVAIEARYAFYTNQVGGGVDFDFSRHTVFLGLSVWTEGATVDGRGPGG